jgi:thymidylate synthase (FAD)
VRKSYVGQGKVELIAGGGRIYTDVAARFVRSEKPLTEILDAPYSGDLVSQILASGHKAALEFDYFLFGVEGYSRVTEVQLVRKRIASYMLKSGRPDKGGRRSFDVVVPRSVEGLEALVELSASELILPASATPAPGSVSLRVTADCLLRLVESWYEAGVSEGVPEEDLRYLKPQATEFKGLIGMNAHALLDWFSIRCCRNAQAEIRDMADKMLRLCREAAPDLFAGAGPNCQVLGYCPEDKLQNKACRGKVLTRKRALEILKAAR